MWPEVSSTNIQIRDDLNPSEFDNSSSRVDLSKYELIGLSLFDLWKRSRIKKDKIFHILPKIFETDFSSVFPLLEPESSNSLREYIKQKIDSRLEIGYDIILNLPSKRKYILDLEITKKKRAVPKIILPDNSY